MRKRVWIPLTILAVAALGFFGIAPGYLESSMNRIDGKPLGPVSAEAVALHKTLQIVDLHSDSLMWKRNILEHGDRGHEDLPRLSEGNVALQVFSSVSQTPKGLNYDRNSADSDVLTALVIAVVCWLGMRMLQWIPERPFYLIATAALGLSGVKLLWDGVMG